MLQYIKPSPSSQSWLEVNIKLLTDRSFVPKVQACQKLHVTQSQQLQTAWFQYQSNHLKCAKEIRTALSWHRDGRKSKPTRSTRFSKGHDEMNTWIIGPELHASLTSDKMTKQALVQVPDTHLHRYAYCRTTFTLVHGATSSARTRSTKSFTTTGHKCTLF